MLQTRISARRHSLPAFIRTFTLRPQRTLALPLAGAAVGLIIAGIGLFHVIHRPPTTVPPGYAALVNGEPILMSDYINQLQSKLAKPYAQITKAQRANTLHEMINEELMVQRGLALNIPETDTDVRTAISDSVNAQVAAPVLAVRPTDAQLRAYYFAHRSNYATQGTMRLHDIVLHYGGFQNADQTLNQAEADAAEAIFQLRSGASLSYVTQHFGFVSTGHGSSTDMFDFVAKIQLGPKLYAVAAKMSDGQISEPIPTKDGVHVLIMEHRAPPIYTDFNDVRGNVYTDYVNAAQARVQKANLKMLRSRAKIILAPGLSE